VKKISIGSLLLLLLAVLSAETNPEKFRLIHSDKLFLNKAEEEQVLELDGNVHFWYGSTEFKADRALIFDKQKIARMVGHVSVSNDSLALSSDSLAYYRNSGDLNAGGGVRITETRKTGSFRWFESQYAIYNKKDDKLTVWQDVSAWDKDENAFSSCGYAFWDRAGGYAYMIENPFVQSGVEDTLTITADKIEFFDQDRKLVATFNVDVKARDYHATSDFLIYFLKDDKAVFTGEPRFSSDYSTAEAQEFNLYFAERKLTRAELVDSCTVWFAEERLAPQTNWVKAGYVNLTFRDDAIRAFSAEGGVSYFYKQDKTEKKDFFVNQASGDFLEANFNADNKLDRMKMRREIKGVYKFHNNS
jgi:lipopolysaccharide export system protein LptA